MQLEQPASNIGKDKGEMKHIDRKEMTERMSD